MGYISKKVAAYGQFVLVFYSVQPFLIFAMSVSICLYFSLSRRTFRGSSLWTRSTPPSTSTSKFFFTVHSRFLYSLCQLSVCLSLSPSEHSGGAISGHSQPISHSTFFFTVYSRFFYTVCFFLLLSSPSDRTVFFLSLVSLCLFQIGPTIEWPVFKR